MTDSDLDSSVFDNQRTATQPSVARLSDDDLISACEQRGIPVARPRNNNEALRNMWEQVHGLLRMMTDLAENGATLTLTHPAYFSPLCDYKMLTRSAIIGRLDTVLERAVVVKESRDAAA